MSSDTIDTKLINILVVEDNEVDLEAVQRAFKKANITHTLHNAWDGVEALEMLSGTNGKAKLPQPCVILLDINMPRMDGLKLLKELRKSSDDCLHQSIVFMLTTSRLSGDRMLAYESNVAGYFLKENLTELVDILNTYCQINEFSDFGEGL